MKSSKGFGAPQDQPKTTMKTELSKSVKKLKRLLRKPTIVAGLLDKKND